jgi:hypothetical protein
MKPSRPATTAVLLLTLGPAGCECADRSHLDESDTLGDTSLGSSSMVESDGAFDVSRFLGTFHGEALFTPFGYEGYDLGSTVVENVEIRPDDTAGMVWEPCSTAYGPREIAWRWEARADRWLELLPGEGEDSLRWRSMTDLESLRVTVDDQCEIRFEVDGELYPDPFRPGKACWVNRCEGGKAHVDYCELPVPECG